MIWNKKKEPSEAVEVLDENEGLPSVNRKGKSNTIVNVLGVVFILGVGVAAIMAVNSDKPGEKTAVTEKEAPKKVESNLPPLPAPEAPPPIAVQPTVPAVTPGAVTPIQTVPAGRTTQPVTGRGYEDSLKPAETWQSRKMSGHVLYANEGGGTSAPAPVAPPVMPTGASGGLFGGGSSKGDDGLEARLQPTPRLLTRATHLPDRNFVIARPKSLDCVLDHAIDSSIAGITSCTLTQDIYSDNGNVLLLERGTQLDGEYPGGVKFGQERFFVLWVRAKTPSGVIINLNSPAADRLGRIGIDGDVDNHYLKRFGAAFMLSTAKDLFAVFAANRSGSGSGGTNNQIVLGANTTATSEKMAEKILESTINIPPTIRKNQGEHIQVMVAHDLDFSNVYSLRPKKND